MAKKIGIVPITIPRGLFVDPVQLRRVTRNAAEQLSKDIRVDFRVTAQTWDNKPEFIIQRADNALAFTREIKTTDQVYYWVNHGTKAHPIEAKNAPMLRFNTTFKPKTRVMVIGSGKGKSGPPVARKRRVMHPGTEARKFDLVIAKKWTKLAPQVVQRAIDAEIG